MKSFNEISDVYLDVENDTLSAYYTTSDNLDIGEVKDALNNDLPYYMVPSLFIKLDKIPLNINGKIDRKALPLPNFENNKIIVKSRNSFGSSEEHCR